MVPNTAVPAGRIRNSTLHLRRRSDRSGRTPFASTAAKRRPHLKGYVSHPSVAELTEILDFVVILTVLAQVYSAVSALCNHLGAVIAPLVRDNDGCWTIRIRLCKRK